MNNQTVDLINYLSSFAADKRVELFKRKIEDRTRYLTIVLEDIYQPHNASAVLRTSDCFGIQDVHIIENKNKYLLNPDVALGSSKWLNLNQYPPKTTNTVEVIQKLRNQGYRIVATTPHTNDVNLEEFELSKGKMALLFGTELEGLTREALDNSDEFLKIPMVGFTESFNISVSAAIIMHHLSWRLRNSSIDWKLTESEKNEILLSWLKESIRDGEKIAENYLKSKQ